MSPTARRTVTWRSEAAPTSMGMHHYEQRIQQSVRDTADGTWAFGVSRVGNLRGEADCEVRFPARLRSTGGRWLAPLVARGAPGLTHRFDLRLPPARREVVTVHDLPPRRFPDEGLLPDWCLASAQRALEVIVPSEFAAREVADLTGAERITVVPYGLSPQFTDPQPASAKTLAALGITAPFFIHAAGATRRKNLHGLADAWRLLVAQGIDHQLVLCGPPHPNRDRAFDGLPGVLMVGRQPLETVAGLMAASRAVVVPSTYEGFGLPALEGMACGVPVVAARAGALPEVCGDAAVLADPDGAGLAEAMSRVLALTVQEREDLTDRGLRRARSFDWETAAQAHLAVYARNL